MEALTNKKFKLCCLAALNSPGETKIKSKKSRNHTEILLNF